MIGTLGCSSIVLLMQIVTYVAVADAQKPRTLEDSLPPPARCPEVLADGNWLDALSPRQRETAEGILKHRFKKVYRDELDIPSDARSYASNGGDVVWLAELKGVCAFQWFVDGSGPFWFRAITSSHMGKQYDGTARTTYVWVLLKWVDVRTEIGWHA